MWWERRICHSLEGMLFLCFKVSCISYSERRLMSTFNYVTSCIGLVNSSANQISMHSWIHCNKLSFLYNNGGLFKLQPLEIKISY